MGWYGVVWWFSSTCECTHCSKSNNPAANIKTLYMYAPMIRHWPAMSIHPWLQCHQPLNAFMRLYHWGLGGRPLAEATREPHSNSSLLQSSLWVKHSMKHNLHTHTHTQSLGQSLIRGNLTKRILSAINLSTFYSMPVLSCCMLMRGATEWAIM